MPEASCNMEATGVRVEELSNLNSCGPRVVSCPG